MRNCTVCDSRSLLHFVMVISKKLILPFTSSSNVNFSFGDTVLNSNNVLSMLMDFSSR
jgi:hypothetical protein